MNKNSASHELTEVLPNDQRTAQQQIHDSQQDGLSDDGRSLTLGEFAHSVISQQYRRIIKQEKKVLADKDPENLHQMRVNTRRLRTALQVFDPAVELPKAAREDRVKTLAKILGKLRDLDVQTATLKDNYQPQLNSSEQKLLNQALGILHKQRRRAFAGTEETLKCAFYQDFKESYEEWLERPNYKPLAQLSLISILPDLLQPLLSQLFLHSGWLIGKEQASQQSELLHDLRKVCKQVRYQAEFFTQFYGDEFQFWIEEIRQLQEMLGKVQDGQVLSELLVEVLPQAKTMSQLQTTIHQEQQDAMMPWDALREKYLDPEFRQHLYDLILHPAPVS
jgi:CHAD domain-containing protein